MAGICRTGIGGVLMRRKRMSPNVVYVGDDLSVVEGRPQYVVALTPSVMRMSGAVDAKTLVWERPYPRTGVRDAA